ncbi:hypothetical protein EK21DRAFT_86564 [Setomelanomma holmii]|uniref:Uncharacterized protein n=1 Tax=Setomelanomma holmii TaxID=210430 RepID=A0A9P4HDL5_9PLEO|nr:hypothetical protein EK21DRAFT_86564 [Setomelanomma holmii]
MSWELDEYRNMYARAMIEATGPDGDGKYTIKSAIYEALNAALYGGHNGGSVPDLVNRVLMNMTSTRMLEQADVLDVLGRRDWEQGEWKVTREIADLVAPQSEVEPVEPFCAE